MTPLEKLMDYMEQNQYFIGNELLAKYKELLEEEKEIIMDAYWNGGVDVPTHPSTAEDYYNKTFNTKEDE
jgi:hypothetical protein